MTHYFSIDLSTSITSIKMATAIHLSPTPEPKGFWLRLKKRLRRSTPLPTGEASRRLAPTIIGFSALGVCVGIAALTFPWESIDWLVLAAPIVAISVLLTIFLLVLRPQYILRRAFVATLGVAGAKQIFPSLGLTFLIGGVGGEVRFADLSGGLGVSMVIVVGLAFVAAVVETIIHRK